MKRLIFVVLLGLGLLDICSYLESGSGVVSEWIFATIGTVAVVDRVVNGME